MGAQRPQESRLFFSMRVSEQTNIRSLCGGVSENEQEQIFKEISRRVNFDNATEVFCFFVFKFLMIMCSPVWFFDCLF